MKKFEYYNYLKSEDWQIRREIFLSKFKRCFICGKATNLQVHHLFYSKVGIESDADVVVLCKRCHCKVHGIRGKSGAKFKRGTLGKGFFKRYGKKRNKRIKKESKMDWKFLRQRVDMDKEFRMMIELDYT